jgi:hypoxanthine phosphoribosyltransferase
MEKNFRVVYSEEEIQNRVRELAKEISGVISARDLTVVGILDDAFVFLADLIRALDMEISCCFMNATRHLRGGQMEVLFTSEFDPKGRDILLVDGVVATGVTLDFTAFRGDEGFLFGYGLGLQNQYRQLPYLAVFDEK